jgi:hypothetical protein
MKMHRSIHLVAGAFVVTACALSLGTSAGCGSDPDPVGPGAVAATAQGAGGQGGGAGAGGESGGEGGGGGEGAGLTPEVEQCLFVNACEAAEGGEPIGMQACLAHFYQRQWHWASFGDYRLQMESMDCRLAAATCEGVRACDAIPELFDASCALAPGETLCVDDTWVTCDFDGAATAALDCTAAGKTCNVDVWAGCGVEPCTFGATSNSCDPDDGNVLVICSPAGFVERVDCSRENNFVLINGPDGEVRATIAGEICGDDPMLGDKGCIGQGEPCDFFSQACEGDELVTCAGGTLGHRDCAAQELEGQSCGFVTEGPFAGGAACGVVASECDPTGPEACTGGVVSFCAQGKSQSIVCAEAGFAGCDATASDGQTIAYCTR